MNRVPLYLLSGFLGSGKTTLLAELLKSPAFSNTAVVVNELGEIGLDHLILERSTDCVVLLEAGCLCCTIADSLHETLTNLNFRKVRGEVPPFSRVVIETTGLANPAPILNTLLGNRFVTDHYHLEFVVVVVSAQHALSQLAMYSEAVRQIAVADRIVLTKLDLARASPELLEHILQLNPGARVFQSSRGSAALEAFASGDSPRFAVWTPSASYSRNLEIPPQPHHANHHNDRIRAYCLFPTYVASWAGLAAWCKIMSALFGNRLLRCKGLLKIEDPGEVVFIQGVQGIFHRPERLPEWPDLDHRSRLVCITEDIEEAALWPALRALELPAGSDPHITLADLEPEAK